MSQIESIESTTGQWTTICPLERILPNTGVCALISGTQIAVFRVGEEMDVYAIENYDPFSKAYVLSRGLVGDKNGIPKVASPIYKQNFNLLTGECFDDATVKLNTFAVRVMDGQVQVGS